MRPQCETLLVVLFVATACNEESKAPATTTAIPRTMPAMSVDRRDSAGVEIVATRSAGPATDLPWEIESTPRLEVGEETDSVAGFSEIRTAIRLANGGYIVHDVGQLRPTSVVPRLFDSAGRFVRTVGRFGRGPGEYHGVGFVGRYTDRDSLVIADQYAMKVFVYGSGGQPARQGRVHDEPVFYGVVGVLSDGSLLLYHQYQRTANPRTLRTYYRVAVDGTILDTIASGLVMRHDEGQPSKKGGVWFSPSLAAAGARHMHYNDGASFQIRSYSPRGKLERIVRPTLTPRGATKSELAHWREYMIGQVASQGERAISLRKAYLETRGEPDFLRPYSQILEDEDGNIWGAETRLVDDMPLRWHVFDSTGAWLGDVTTPGGWRVHQVGRDFILASRRHTDDIDHLYVHRLIKDAR